MNPWINQLCVVGLVLCHATYAFAGEPAWWSQMKVACRSSGGHPVSEYYNDWVSGGGCVCPGSSSGSGQATCSGGSSSGGSSSSSLPSANSELARTLGTAVGKAIADSIRGNPEEEVARKAQQEAQVAEQKRKAEEQARKDEETKQRLLGSMEGIDSSSQLGLMGGGTSDLQLMTGDQSASANSNENSKQTQSEPKSTAFTKGYNHASQCISQNAGPSCAGLSGEEWQTCLADYRAGYQVGDKDRQLRMQQARHAGQLDGAKDDGKLSKSFSNPHAVGPCRLEWLDAYKDGYNQEKHAKSR